MSVKGMDMLRKYSESDSYTLEQLYKRPSKKKVFEFNYIVGHSVPARYLHSVRIWGNYQKFSLGYVDKDAEELHVFTATYEYVVNMHSGEIRTWYYR